MSRLFRRFSFASLVVGLCLVVATHADELKLKDGTKVTGTIVGFEENSFKVKTSYGYATVMKDRVVSITMSDTAKTSDAAAATKPPKNDASKSSNANPAPTSKTVEPLRTSTPTISVSDADAHSPAAGSASPPPAAKPAAPEQVRESVTGTRYTNDTYGFQMYKPPTWKVIEGAQTILPGSIAAMGTDDQTTYLLIGQDPAGKSLATDIDATERRLREILDNFRPIDDKHVTIGGLPAIERHFRGSVDQKDWSGVVVYLTKDGRVYTIFGMTLAATDLVQIQENVIARTISSVQFTK